MAIGVRPIGTRAIGDSSLGAVAVVTGGDPNALTGDPATSLTFGGSGTLLIAPPLAGSSAVSLTYGGTGTLSAYASLMSADPNTSPGDKLKFAGYGLLHVEVPVVAPPATLTYVKRISPIMPAAVLDARGNPT